MHPDVFLSLPAQMQFKLVQEVMTKRPNHLQRTDMHGKLTLKFREIIDDLYIGNGSSATAAGMSSKQSWV